MKYFFVSLVFVFFFFTKSNGLNATSGNDSLQLLVQQNDEKLPKLISAKTEITAGNLKQDSAAANQTYKLERQGSYIIGYIDRKNSQQFDRRYTVYKNSIQEDGTVKPVKIAVVKSMKTPYVQNIQSENQFRTAFYQISGKQINGQNAYLKKNQGTGINLIAGNTYNGFSGTTGRVEYYFSRNLGDMILPEKAGKGLTSVKIYFEAAQKKDSYNLSENSENFTFRRGSLGFGKDYYPLRFLHWGPFAGYGIEYARWENSDNLISTNFAEFGARVGINIRHNIQIIGSGTYYLLIDSVLMNGSRDVIQPNFDYYHTFLNRTGMGFNVGLRLML
ncbi:hypothetical protein [Mariniphaga sp.]|uniref:hypothetical protein n=1 Tax=Mariniphaga sp. TaxID=1954475 RepID=UPI00356529AF